MPKKEYWWVSVGGSDCEPAVVMNYPDRQYREIFTFGCPDALTTDNVDLVERMIDIPDTPQQAQQKRAAWDKKREADRKRGVIHGYRRFD